MIAIILRGVEDAAAAEGDDDLGLRRPQRLEAVGGRLRFGRVGAGTPGEDLAGRTPAEEIRARGSALGAAPLSRKVVGGRAGALEAPRRADLLADPRRSHRRRRTACEGSCRVKSVVISTTSG